MSKKEKVLHVLNEKGLISASDMKVDLNTGGITSGETAASASTPKSKATTQPVGAAARPRSDTANKPRPVGAIANRDKSDTQTQSTTASLSAAAGHKPKSARQGTPLKQPTQSK